MNAIDAVLATRDALGFHRIPRTVRGHNLELWCVWGGDGRVRGASLAHVLVEDLRLAFAGLAGPPRTLWVAFVRWVGSLEAAARFVEVLPAGRYELLAPEEYDDADEPRLLSPALPVATLLADGDGGRIVTLAGAA